MEYPTQIFERVMYTFLVGTFFGVMYTFLVGTFFAYLVVEVRVVRGKSDVSGQVIHIQKRDSRSGSKGCSVFKMRSEANGKNECVAIVSKFEITGKHPAKTQLTSSPELLPCIYGSFGI